SLPPIAGAGSMRFGTFNVGLGFLRKLPRVLVRCSELELDVVDLQEIGDPALLTNRLLPCVPAYAAGPLLAPCWGSAMASRCSWCRHTCPPDWITLLLAHLLTCRHTHCMPSCSAGAQACIRWS